MLHRINLLSNHKTFKLNKHIYYFLLKLKDVPPNALFDPYGQYFKDDLLTKVNNSPKLKLRFEEFFNDFIKLSPSNRENVILTFKNSQKVEVILSDTGFDGNSITLLALPTRIRKSSKALFLYLYKNTLLSYGKKDHYEKLFNQTVSSICPFCGLEKLATPDFFCQDYDHILYKDKYPLSSVNMRNLIPMGTDCNRIHKKETDVIHHNDGTRRIFLNPYTSSQNISITLAGSELPKGGDDKGLWVINILPDNDYTSTWEEVFNIKERYRKSELEKYFSIWLSVFKDYLRPKHIIWTEVMLRLELKNTGESFLKNPLDVSNIVKGSLFTFLSECTDQSFFSALIKDLNR